LTSNEARVLQAKKKAKDEAIHRKKRATAYTRARNRIKEKYRKIGVLARKEEAARKKAIKGL
jgi:hypothetical protein